MVQLGEWWLAVGGRRTSHCWWWLDLSVRADGLNTDLAFLGLGKRRIRCIFGFKQSYFGYMGFGPTQRV